MMGALSAELAVPPTTLASYIWVGIFAQWDPHRSFLSLLPPVCYNFESTTSTFLRSVSTLSTCSAFTSSSPLSPSSLSVGFFTVLSLDVWADHGRFFVAVSVALANPLPVQGVPIPPLIARRCVA